MLRRFTRKHTITLVAFALTGVAVSVGSLNTNKMSGLFRRFKNWILGGVWQPDPEMRKQIPFTNFPKTLEGFGYHFNEEGEMRDIKTNERFQFEARETDPYYNQKRYEAVGDAVTLHIDEVMIEKHNLKKVTVPIDPQPNEPSSYFFMSEDAMTAPRLMVLIHGSGAVRAGQWSRRLIINENLKTGSQLPYIERAQAEGYGLIITNTNLNTVTCNRQQVSIRENENAEYHGKYVWKHFVTKAAARDIAIVAHSYGGIVTVFTGSDFPKDFLRRVFAIAFTDSVHGYTLSRVHPVVKKLLKERAINYASSTQPLGAPLTQSDQEDCPAVSAGTSVHELTSWNSMDLVFKFFEDRYAAWVKEEDREKVTAELEAERAEQGFVAASDPSMDWQPDDSHLIKAGVIKADETTARDTAERESRRKAEGAAAAVAKEEPVKGDAAKGGGDAARKAEEGKAEQEADTKAQEAGNAGAEERAKESVEVPVEQAEVRQAGEAAPAAAAAAAGDSPSGEQDAGVEKLEEKMSAVTIEDEKSGEKTPVTPAGEGEATAGSPDAVAGGEGAKREEL